MASIRIRTKDIQSLNKLNKSLYRKERRLSNKFDKSTGIERKKIDDFSTRKEFNAYIKQVQKATKRTEHRYIKNEKGLVIPFEDVRSLKNAERQYRKRVEKNEKKLQNTRLKSKGNNTEMSLLQFKKLNKEYSTYGNTFNINNFTTLDGVKRAQATFSKLLTKEHLAKQNRLFKENYIRALENNFGKEAGALINKIKRMRVDSFIKFSDDEYGDINYVYRMEDIKQRVSNINETVKEYS